MHYAAQDNVIKQVGLWNHQDKLQVFDSKSLKADDNITEVETLVVVTKEEIPYVMLRQRKTGNAAYDGFAIDLLKVFDSVHLIMICISCLPREQTNFSFPLSFFGNHQLELDTIGNR